MTKQELIDIIKKFRETATDKAALEGTELYKEWQVDVAYVVDERIRYEGILYKCLQAHTSQSTWTPIAAPSLWAKVLIPTPTEIPEWEQPSSTNPYAKGDKVKHNGKIWISTIDGNVWVPGVYGWEETSA